MGKTPWGRGVRGQFVAAAALIAAVPLVALISTDLLLGVRHEQQETAIHVAQAARVVAGTVNVNLRGHVWALEGLAGEWAASDALSDPALSERLARWHAHYPRVLTMLATDRTGQKVAASPAVNADGSARVRAGESVADRDYFQRALADDAPFVSGVFRGRAVGNDVIVAVSVPLHDRKGAVAGVIEASLDLRRLASVAELFQAVEGTEVVILDRSGRVVVATPSTGLSPLDVLPAEFEKVPAIESRAGTDFGWSVRVRQPRSVLRRVEVRMALISFAVGVAVLGVILLLARFLTSATTRPLERLAEAMERVAESGEADGAALEATKIVVEPTAPAEVRQLAEHFDLMARRLVETRSHLREVLRGLEETVAERTAELKASGEMFSRTFQLNPTPMALNSVPDGNYLDVNRAFVTMLGYSREEMIGANPAEVGVMVEPDHFAKGLQELLEHGTLQGFEAAVRRKDGACRLGLFAGAVLEGHGGPFILTVMEDVTELRQRSEELELRVAARTKDLAESKQELEAFSYAVSHDLRAPLRAIAGFSHLLRQHIGERAGTEGERLHAVIEGSALKMGRLIDGLLRFTRTGQARVGRSTLDLAEMARQALAELVPEPERSRWDVRISPLPPAYGDRDLVGAALRELLSNAVKFSAGRERPVVEVGHREGERGTEFFVRDNGIGFDARYMGKLFGVFQRLHVEEGFEGTGIGLALVKRIVERHGGRVWAEGAPGAGATFWFTLGPSSPSRMEG